MDKRELLNKIRSIKDQKTLDEINMLKTNKKINRIVKDICKYSIDLAKLNLIDSPDNEENKINLYKIIRKNIDEYNELNKLKYNCNVCKDKIILNGKICNCFQNMIKKSCIESFDEDLPLNLFNFDNFDLRYYSDEFDKHLNCSYKTLIKRTFDFCMNYAKTFNKESDNLLFIGGTGLGKTHLACSISNEVAKNKFSVMYVSLPRELIENNKLIDSDVRRKKLNSDLLVIDDLGIENLTPFNNSFLYNLINIRIVKRLQTILITNLSIKELEKRYNHNIFSRIIGNFSKVVFAGNDIRQQIHEQKMKKRGET